MRKWNESQQRELEKMMSGKPYDASDNTELLDILQETQEMCRDYNNIRPSHQKEKDDLIKRILGKTGKQLKVIQPFFCDYGFNIEVGERFFANTNMVILDEAKVIFGNNVFIGPNCAFYTPCHPIDAKNRNAGIQWSLPITVGDDVWFGGNVTVCPGVTIGNGSVIGAGSVVTTDIPANVIAAGNPCRVIKEINQ
jgi:galactoside O-acetyltransferase